MGPGGGDNKMNEGTSFQPSEPIPCTNGCGFFGTPATNNFCSKCFRDLKMKEESELEAKAAFQKFAQAVAKPQEKQPFEFRTSGPLLPLGAALPPGTVLPPGSITAQPSPINFTALAASSAGSGPSLFFGQDPAKVKPGGIFPGPGMSCAPSIFSSVTFNRVPEGEVLTFGRGKEPEKPPVNRCGCCNKKVGVMGFACRCGTTFCGTHRYPESHDCTFDYKAQGREAIAKANPVVKGDKIQRF